MEQSLIEDNNNLFTQTPQLDENNNKIKAASAKSTSATTEQSQVTDTNELSLSSVSNTIDNTLSLNDTTRSTAGNANADLLDNDNTEATTAAIENLRTDSISSVDGKFIHQFSNP